jgi:hypothetical protein
VNHRVPGSRHLVAEDPRETSFGKKQRGREIPQVVCPTRHLETEEVLLTEWKIRREIPNEGIPGKRGFVERDTLRQRIQRSCTLEKQKGRGNSEQSLENEVGEPYEKEEGSN